MNDEEAILVLGDSWASVSGSFLSTVCSLPSYYQQDDDGSSSSTYSSTMYPYPYFAVTNNSCLLAPHPDRPNRRGEEQRPSSIAGSLQITYHRFLITNECGCIERTGRPSILYGSVCVLVYTSYLLTSDGRSIQ